jgi:hypothetical protein
VLHVVLSMLLTAGLIVYINQSQATKNNVTTATQKYEAANTRANRLEADVAAARADADRVVQDAANRVRAITGELQNAQRTLADREAQLAKGSQDLAAVSAALTSANEAIQLAQGTQQTLQTQIAELRTSADKNQQRSSELEIALSDRNNRLQVAQRQIEELNDELTYSQQQGQQGRQQRETGARPAGAQSSAAPAGGGQGGAVGAASPIIGQVQGKRVIQGVPYATINVGAAENVQKDMTFYVINRRTGDYLGTLTVVNVEQNEATGRLSGPRIDQIGQGAEARTQL